MIHSNMYLEFEGRRCNVPVGKLSDTSYVRGQVNPARVEQRIVVSPVYVLCKHCRYLAFLKLELSYACTLTETTEVLAGFMS